MAVGSTTPRGHYPDGVSVYGVHDLAGNVREWVSDWWGVRYYSTAPRRNPPGPESGPGHVVRGGSWLDPPMVLRSFERHFSPAHIASNRTGFRCVKGLP